MKHAMQFFDSHCHFDFALFDGDRELIWRECNALGVAHLLIPGVAPEQWPLAAAIAQQHTNIYRGVGVHPFWVKPDVAAQELAQYLATIDFQLQQHSAQPTCVAIGECGLDASIATPMQLQQQVLAVHLQLAQQVSLPLIIHCRKAHNELLRQLKSYDLPAGGVIHGFSGSYELAASYWAMGLRLGIGGTITYERANKTRTAVQKLPLDALLLETDAPDMPLSGKQGERNSPAHIIAIAQTLADLRGEPLANIAAQTTLNARTLFKIDT
jgi:TatD DNase family protein